MATVGPPVEDRAALSDRAAVVLAVVGWLGALHPRPVMLLIPVGVVAASLLARRPVLLMVGVAMLASTMSERAWNGLHPPPDRRVDHEVVTLVADPTETPFGVRVDARLGTRRVELRASQGAAGTLSRLAAGERALVTGQLRASPLDAPWLVPRHVSGRLTVSSLELVDGGALPYRAANRFRRLLERGARPLSEPARALYGGFVVGDDRNQPPEIADDFRAAGLTHVLVVSGSNVAFLLVVVSPLLRRFGLAGRWSVTIGVILGFAVVTRFEPSVVRASVMAAIAVTGSLMGRPASGVRVLALAVTALVVVDPLLVHSVGFQLSVGASAGILFTSGWIRDRLPGPLLLREAISVTTAAQLGVLPLLIGRFGGLPVVALPANVLAVPVAGLVTTWGLPAGVVGGVAGGRVAGILQWPTGLMIGWVAGVARVAAGVPLGELTAREAIVVVGAAGGALWWRGHRPTARAGPRVLASIAAVALLAPGVALREPAAGEVDIGADARLLRGGGGTVLLIDRALYPEDVLEGLRRAGVRRLDAVLWSDDADADLLRALRHRWTVRRSIEPSDARVRFRVGSLTVSAGGGAAPRVETGPDP